MQSPPSLFVRSIRPRRRARRYVGYVLAGLAVATLGVIAADLTVQALRPDATPVLAWSASQ